MPPKKKKSSKKSGKKGKKSGKEIQADEVQIDEPELNREFFIFHIKDLERKLKLYKAKVKKLQGDNKEFMDKQKELNKDKKDTIESLKKNLLNRGDELSDRRDRYKGLLQANETEKARYEAKLQEIQSKLQETKDNLTSENNLLSAKLAALEEFKLQKDKYLEEYSELERVREEKKVLHEGHLDKIDHKLQRDHDRLKKEIVAKINLVAAEFRKISQKQTSETTKRTIRENVSISSQLTKMEDKNLELMQENEQMRLKIRENRMKLKELENSHTDLASKNSSHNKLIHMLMFKYQEYQEIRDQYYKDELILNHVAQENVTLSDQISQRKNTIQEFARQNDEIQAIINTSQEQQENLNQELDAAKNALIESIQQLKELLQTTRPRSKKKSGKARAKSSNKSKLSSVSYSDSPSPANEEICDLEEDNEFIREWGDLEQRTLADEKLQKLLDALDYCDNEDLEIDSESINEKSSYIPKSSDHRLVESPSISIASKRIISAATTERKTTPSNQSTISKYKEFLTNTQTNMPPILSDFEIKRQARLMMLKQRNGMCVPGLLQMVPPMSRHIPNNQEKAYYLNKRLIGLDKYQNEEEIEKPIKNESLKASKEARTRFLAG